MSTLTLYGLIASFFLILLGWITGITILSLIGGIFLIPMGVAVLGAFIWQIINR